MDKITYLAELAEGLARWVPQRERQDILRWYAEYFEEAGPEREAEVVAELGDPWALSCRLAVEGGYVTQEQAVSWRPGKTWPKVLIGAAVGLSVFALFSAIGLAFNVMRGVTGITRTGVAVAAPETVPPGMFSAFEIAPDGTLTFMDSEYVAYVDGSAFADSCLLDGEGVTPFRSIDVELSLGSIEVLAGDSYSLSVQRSETLRGYEPVWEITDGVFRLRDSIQAVRADSWEDLKSLFGMGQGTVEVIITVPENAALDTVSLKTGLGDVLLYGVDAGTVIAESGVGDVECYEARNVRRLELNSGVGDVGLGLAEVCPGLNANLNSGTGSVEASLGCSEGDCQYELESGLGLVTVNGAVLGSIAERRGGTLCRLCAKSGTGGVNVYFIDR